MDQRGLVRALQGQAETRPWGGSSSSCGHQALASGLLLSEGCESRRQCGRGKSRTPAGHSSTGTPKAARLPCSRGVLLPQQASHPQALPLAAGGMPAAGHPSPAPFPSAFSLSKCKEHTAILPHSRALFSLYLHSLARWVGPAEREHSGQL